MSTEKFSMPFEVLRKKQKVESFLTDKVDYKTVLDVLRIKHPEPPHRTF